MYPLYRQLGSDFWHSDEPSPDTVTVYFAEGVYFIVYRMLHAEHPEHGSVREFGRVLLYFFRKPWLKPQRLDFVNVTFNQEDVERIEQTLRNFVHQSVFLINCPYSGIRNGFQAYQMKQALTRGGRATMYDGTFELYRLMRRNAIPNEESRFYRLSQMDTVPNSHSDASSGPERVTIHHSNGSSFNSYHMTWLTSTARAPFCRSDDEFHEILTCLSREEAWKPKRIDFVGINFEMEDIRMLQSIQKPLTSATVKRKSTFSTAHIPESKTKIRWANFYMRWQADKGLSTITVTRCQGDMMNDSMPSSANLSSSKPTRKNHVLP